MSWKYLQMWLGFTEYRWSVMQIWLVCQTCVTETCIKNHTPRQITSYFLDQCFCSTSPGSWLGLCKQCKKFQVVTGFISLLQELYHSWGQETNLRSIHLKQHTSYCVFIFYVSLSNVTLGIENLHFPSIFQIVSCKWCYCIQYTKCYQMSKISLF